MRNGSIVVFHDSDEKDQADRQPTVEALKIILPVLQAGGYRLVTVSELMAGNNTLVRHHRGLSSKIH